jgi:hypothetical protein
MSIQNGTYRLPGDRMLDLNAWQQSLKSTDAYIFAEPPYGSMLIGCESMSMTFRVARGVTPPNMLAPSVAVYRKIIPRSNPKDGSPWSPEFADRVYVFWAELKGTALGVDQYYFHVDGLVQDTTYYLEITAASTEYGGLSNAPTVQRTYQSWAFRTPRREVTVDTTSLDIYRDGDPGGSGEMYFNFAAFDGENGLPFGSGRYPEKGDAIISDGTVISNPFGSFFKRNTSNTIYMQIYGQDDDTHFPYPGQGFDLHGTGFSNPADLPDSWNEGSEEDMSVSASAGKRWRLLQFPGIYEQPFSLYSGNWGVSFSVNGRIHVEVIPHPQAPLLLSHATHSSAPLTQLISTPQKVQLSRNERLNLRAERDYQLLLESQNLHAGESSQSKKDS